LIPNLATHVAGSPANNSRFGFTRKVSYNSNELPAPTQFAPRCALNGSVRRMPVVSSNSISVLIVDDEPYILPTLAALVGREFEVITASSADEAQTVLE